jgi:hypothetical protein
LSGQAIREKQTDGLFLQNNYSLDYSSMAKWHSPKTLAQMYVCRIFYIKNILDKHLVKTSYKGKIAMVYVYMEIS